MPNRDFNELVDILRPPAPEVPRAEQLERERLGIFHSHTPGTALHSPENPAREFQPDSGPAEPIPMGRAAVCVLDERGGHIKLGERCPHFGPDWNRDEVIQVEF